MKIRIDSSKCNSIIQGYSHFNNGMEDYWYYSDHTFETGKSYGLISEYIIVIGIIHLYILFIIKIQVCLMILNLRLNKEL